MPRYTGVLVAYFFVIVCFAITGTMFPAFWHMPDCSDLPSRSTGGEIAANEIDSVRPAPEKPAEKKSEKSAKKSEAQATPPPAPTPIQEATMPRPTRLEPLSEIKKSLEPVEPESPGSFEKTGQPDPAEADPAKETAKEPARNEQPDMEGYGKPDTQSDVQREPAKAESLPLPRKAEPLADFLGRNDASPQNTATPQPRVAAQKTAPPPAPSLRETVAASADPSRSDVQGLSKSALTAMDKPPTMPKDPDFATAPKTGTPDLPRPAAAESLPRYADKKAVAEETSRKIGTQKDAPTTYGTRTRAEAIKRQALGADLPPNPTESWWGN